jgi:hypothetical protein
MKYYIFAILLAFLYGLLGYFVTTSLYLGLGIGAIFALALCFLVVPLVLHQDEKERKRHECYRFLNTFIISLSVSQSGERALEAASVDMKGEEKDIFDAIDALSIEEKLGYFANYFEDTSYAMFLSIFRLFESQGGDVLELAEPLLKEITLQEENGDALVQIRKRNLVQFASLWGMSYLVLGFTRWGLNNFYGILASSIPYVATEMVYFAVALVAIVLFAQRYTGIRVGSLRRKKDAKLAPSKN